MDGTGRKNIDIKVSVEVGGDVGKDNNLTLRNKIHDALLMVSYLLFFLWFVFALLGFIDLAISILLASAAFFLIATLFFYDRKRDIAV